MTTTTTELTHQLNTAYSLLKQTAESDVRSAGGSEDSERPALPAYLDAMMYTRLMQAVELERDVEAGLITVDDMD